MSHFIQTGSVVRIADEKDIKVLDHLPPDVYTVMATQEGLVLKRIDQFELPPKIYGDAPRKAKRILDTFTSRPLSTGVHLNGVKGSGKSLTAKLVCVEALKQGIPTIVVNHAYTGDAFNAFIQSIDCPAIVLMDEFEKVYDRECQEGVLTLFDGVYPTKKLFMLTTNDKYKVDSMLINRPGRMFYSLEYNNLEELFIKEFLEDTLNDKTKIAGVVGFCKAYPFINFDMLKAVVEDMNRYNEGLDQVLEYLNISPETADRVRYNVFLVHKGKESQVYTDYSASGGIAGFSYRVDLAYELESTDLPELHKKATSLDRRGKRASVHFNIDNLKGFL